MKLVLDTNVLVAGLLNAFGPPGRLVALVAAGRLRLCHDARILIEYGEVLRRPRFAFSQARVTLLLDQVAAVGVVVSAAPWQETLPDPDDAPFLEVAAEAKCPLVTGNLRHFPARCRRGVEVMTPAEFVDEHLRSAQ